MKASRQRISGISTLLFIRETSDSRRETGDSHTYSGSGHILLPVTLGVLGSTLVVSRCLTHTRCTALVATLLCFIP